VHASTKNIRRFKPAVDEFDKENKDKRTLKLAGGDLNFASDLEPNVLMIKLMNLIGLDATCVGNHELEGGNYWAKAIELAKPKFKFLSANLNFSRPNEVENKIAKSTIVEKNGEKVGIIGVSPLDAEELVFKADFNDFATVKDFDKTVDAVKKEVKQLEKQGINKICLLAHTGEKSKVGFDYYENLAKIGGIDIIIGGHDHKEYDNWFTSKRGEPVKVISTEAANDKNKSSEDLGTFGVLRAVFDKKGVLVTDKCKNTIKSTKNYPISAEVEKLEAEILQGNKKICYSKTGLECKNRKTKENPVADLVADSMFWMAQKVNPQSKAQIVLINSGEIKADIPKDDITVQDIKDALPFAQNVNIVEAKFTKKQLIEALNWGVETTTFEKQTLGLLQVGGMRYTVGLDNKVKDVYLTDRKGNLGECLDEMPDDKEYTVLYDTYLMQGPGGMSSLKKGIDEKDVKIYPFNPQNGLLEYLTENFSNKPLEVRTGRIEVESQESNIEENEFAPAY